jgi:hypothetical protein
MLKLRWGLEARQLYAHLLKSLFTLIYVGGLMPRMVPHAFAYQEVYDDISCEELHCQVESHCQVKSRVEYEVVYDYDYEVDYEFD